MSYRFIFLGLLIFSASGTASKFKHQPISTEAKSYVHKSLKVNELLEVCNQYEYEIVATGVITKTNSKEKIEIVNWIVADNIGTKMDLHIYGFKTTNGKVTSELELVHESSDWQFYLDECKADNKTLKQDQKQFTVFVSQHFS